MAAAFRHPNIATVYQFGIREETGQCFYAMELIEGETLEARVRRTGPLRCPGDNRDRAPGCGGSRRRRGHAGWSIAT